MGDPEQRARAIVQAVTHWDNPRILAEVGCDLGEGIVGINVAILLKEELMAVRGW